MKMKKILSLVLAMSTAFCMSGVPSTVHAEAETNYTVLDWQPTQGFWNSADPNAATELQTHLKNFISSGVMFTREDIPNGSIIEISDGYQYRPEGWVSLEPQGSRQDNTRAPRVVVDDAWWGNYNYRAFNVSKTAGGNFTADDIEEVRTKLRIYVPVQPGEFTLKAYDKSSGEVTVYVKNLNGVVSVAAYAEDGTLKSIQTVHTSELEKNPVVNVGTDGVANVIAYCWDSLESMKPLANKITTIGMEEEGGVKIVKNNDGPAKAGTTLTAELADTDALYFEYQWQKSKDGVSFSDVITDTSQKYYVTNQDKDSYITCEVTPVYANGEKGDTLVSKDVYHITKLGNVNVDSPTSSKRFATRFTPDENRFSIEGSTRPFVLLDQYDDSDSAFYILADYITTPLEQHKTDPQRIDPEDEDSIGYWLNNSYAKDGYEIAGTKKSGLESAIYDYVDKNHIWWVEAGIEGVDDDSTEDYSYTAGIGMLTQSESIKYIDRYGWCVASEHGGWAVNWQTATGSEDTDQYVMIDNFTVTSESSIYNAGEHSVYDVTPGNGHKEFYARPSFYLGEDFFRSVRLNVASVGDNVKKMLKSRYTAEELSDIYSQAELETLGMFTEDTPGVEPTEGLKVLAIGNSFSVDSMEYLYNIASELTDENIVLGNMYVGGCTLNMHNSYAKQNAMQYTYYKNTSGIWETNEGYTLQRGILDEDWDIITIQQASGVSGVADTYNQDLTELVAYVKSKAANPNVKLGWNMTWAYQQDSTHPEFPTYNSDQMTMYNAITSAVQSKIVPNKDFDFVIPTGTSIQNVRTSYVGDTLTRDGFHLNLALGRYVAALTWAKQITGAENVDAVEWVPDMTAINASYLRIAKEAVNNAYKKPYAVTNSVYTSEPKDVVITSDSGTGAGARLTASLADTDAQSFKYRWLTSTDGENFTPMYNQNTDTFVITNQDKNRYITCDVTPVLANGTEKEAVRAITKIHITKLGTVSAESVGPERRFETAKTPAANLFSIAGNSRKYVLLDKFNDNNSMFYVMADYLTANMNADSRIMDVTMINEANGLGHWLNNDYTKTGYEIAGVNKEPLEPAIYDYVDKNHTWWIESGINGMEDDLAEDRSFTAGIGLMSESESRKYLGVYGWHIGTEHGNWTNPWALATGSKASNKYIAVMNHGFSSVETIYGAGEQTIFDYNSHGGEVYARPSFYLGKDFFTNVKLDVDSLGENVKKVIRDTYTADQLMIYSKGELRKLGYTVLDASLEADTETIGAKTTLQASMGDPNAVGYEYQWMKSDAEAGSYTDIKTAVSDKYFVTNQDKSSYIKCKITPVYANGTKGSSTVTDAAYVENLGRVSLYYPDDATRTLEKDTPTENVFSIAGSERRLILLDEFNDNKSTYYVMPDYLTNCVAQNTSDPSQLDPENPSSVAYWLNNDFLDTGYELGGVNWPKLETSISSHIDKNHVWWVEAGIKDESDSTAYNDYSYTAGVGILTESESVKYKNKFGWNTATENGAWRNQWYLATGNSESNKYAIVHNFTIGEDGNLWGAGGHELKDASVGQGERYPRLSFYLDNDFFKSVKLDLSKTGDAVKEVLKNNYTRDELSAIYSYSELSELGFDNPISIVGNVNGEINIKVEYVHNDDTPVMLAVEYTAGDVNGRYDYDDYLFEGDSVSEMIPVDELPLGENTITISLLIDEEVVGTLTQTINVIG